MPEHPAELPAEGEGGGGRIDWTRVHGGIGGPNELPPPDWARISVSQLVNEIFRLRDRVHYLESGMLAVKMRGVGGFFGGGVGGPNELPEGEGGSGGGGGGGGRVPFPGEIHEINELPISRFLTELSSLVARFNQFERQVTQQLGAITKRLDAMKK
jgi:hypothetical protein